jgi:hypothetical protein
VDPAGSTAARQRDFHRMDWLFYMLSLTSAVEGIDSGSARPSTHELDVIEVLAGVIVNESLCSRCGAPLGRFVQLQPSNVVPQSSWTLGVRTSCRGWRRHSHSADVTECGGDLIFGTFHR